MSKVRTTLEALERHIPDGRPKRKLPDIVDGSVDPIEMAKKYSFERSKRMQNRVGNQHTAHSLTPDTHAHSSHVCNKHVCICKNISLLSNPLISLTCRLTQMFV